MKKTEDYTWLVKRFGIPLNEILWYNSGTCYSRIGVTTEKSAHAVSNSVKNDTVNGGMLHGMPLGGISKIKNEDGSIYYDVIC